MIALLVSLIVGIGEAFGVAAAAGVEAAAVGVEAAAVGAEAAAVGVEAAAVGAEAAAAGGAVAEVQAAAAEFFAEFFAEFGNAAIPMEIEQESDMVLNEINAYYYEFNQATLSQGINRPLRILGVEREVDIGIDAGVVTQSNREQVVDYVNSVLSKDKYLGS